MRKCDYEGRILSVSSSIRLIEETKRERGEEPMSQEHDRPFKMFSLTSRVKRSSRTIEPSRNSKYLPRKISYHVHPVTPRTSIAKSPTGHN